MALAGLVDTVMVMGQTTVIASLATQRGAAAAMEILRANGIQCSTERPPGFEYATSLTGANYGAQMLTGDYLVFVPKEDERRARDALEGAFGSEWFLRAADGSRFHSFESATVDVLRQYAATSHPADPSTLREANHLADLMERGRCRTVYDAFHERHFLRRRQRAVEGRSLDDWARSCGCYHQHRPLGR